MDYNKIAADITYKPGWFFTYEPGVRDQFVIHGEVADSRTGDTVRFKMRRIIPSALPKDMFMFLEWVKDILIEAEIHELREFLRFRGVLLDGPHQVEKVTKEHQPAS